MQKKNLAIIFQKTQEKTEELCQPLLIEDYVIQSIMDVSPPKWHLAHTAWFFEEFLLKPSSFYKEFNPSFTYRFNSYYYSIGKPFLRSHRGILSRPSTEEVYRYRKYVREHILTLIASLAGKDLKQKKDLITLGIQHEEQHQELLLMDIKHNFAQDPEFPCYQPPHVDGTIEDNHFPETKPSIEVEGGLVEIGYSGNNFSFDNEKPLHKKFLRPYLIAPKLVSNGEYIEFIEAKGYQNALWWLADGWDWVVKHKPISPLYWVKIDSSWYIFTLHGLKKLDLSEPVSHINYYEASAYAAWRGYRLPTEEEWEHFVTMATLSTQEGNFLEKGLLHPQKAKHLKNNPQQFFGDLWEWTASPYLPYPGYRPLNGSLSEYNGKFMNNQIVMRGGCCLTPQLHMRRSYRNFFQPSKRWQFSGIRLAADSKG